MLSAFGALQEAEGKMTLDSETQHLNITNTFKYYRTTSSHQDTVPPKLKRNT